jgi:cell division protein FtsQ
LKRINNKIAKKKKKEKKHISKKLIILLCIIIFIIALIVLSNLLHVKNINIIIDGITNQTEENVSQDINLSEEEIKNLSGISIGDNLFRINKNSSIDKIKTNSYVDTVTISLNLNGTVSINVVPRIVKYLINYAGSYIYIDSQGYIMEISSEAKSVPILLGTTTDFSGLSTGKITEVSRLNDEDLDKLKTVNSIVDSATSNEVIDYITSIDITDEKNYTLSLESERKTVYLGDCSELNTRILYMKAIIEKEKENSGSIYINADINSGGYVYFKESN